jgi:hypothetical protein
LQAARRTCLALSRRHPCSAHALSLPSEAARIMYLTMGGDAAPTVALPGPHPLQTLATAAMASEAAAALAVPGPVDVAGTSCTGGGVPDEGGTGVCDTAPVAPVAPTAPDQGQWIGHLHRMLAAPRRWQDMCAAMEKRVFHRAQLLSWAQRYLQVRHARAMANLGHLMRRVAEVQQAANGAGAGSGAGGPSGDSGDGGGGGAGAGRV